ncbi:MAG TPA: serine hydrolase [Acidimicrobiia bacterium]|nr:serine hydrolase [Acidimicrobiia bacterium]
MLPAALVSLALSIGPGPLHAPVPPATAYPLSPPPVVDAAAWKAWSVTANAEIGSLNADRQRPLASLTKLLTAILVVENASLLDSSTISATAAAAPLGYIGQPAIRRGEVWLVGQLLEMMMVQSSNDASVALAEHISGSVGAFVQLMNQRAAEIGMNDSRFRNPNGLDAVGHYSSANDIIRLGLEALKHPEVLAVVRVRQVSFAIGGRQVKITATNRDLGVYPEFLGLRTGDTLMAGQTLLAYVEAPRGDILAVVLGSTDRRKASRALLAWASQALGPRDYLLAPATQSAAGDTLPDWYHTRLEAALAPLPTGDPTPGRASPLTDALDARINELMPGVLGGGR